MKFNKSMQYALLMVLYIERSGRASTQTVAENLHLPFELLQQIANKLRKAGVLASSRGPGGGYSLVGSPTVMDVVTPFIGPKSPTAYSASRNVEKRALARYMNGLTETINPLLKTRISSLNAALVDAELAVTDMVDAEVVN